MKVTNTSDMIKKRGNSLRKNRISEIRHDTELVNLFAVKLL
jgi:hypothetical protein